MPSWHEQEMVLGGRGLMLLVENAGCCFGISPLEQNHPLLLTDRVADSDDALGSVAVDPLASPKPWALS